MAAEQPESSSGRGHSNAVIIGCVAAVCATAIACAVILRSPPAPSRPGPVDVTVRQRPPVQPSLIDGIMEDAKRP